MTGHMHDIVDDGRSYNQPVSRGRRRKLLHRAKALPAHQQVTVVTYVVSRSPQPPLTSQERAIEASIIAQFAGSRWFHGGAPGLAQGELLLPSKDTGQDPRGLGAAIERREALVYITPHEFVAGEYAKMFGEGQVYDVEPDGVQIDPINLRTNILLHQMQGGAWLDKEAFHSFCCARAKILKAF